MIVDFLFNVFSYIPHFNFHFKKVKPTFDVDFRGEYVQSLLLLAAFCGVILLLLLCTIATIWICQCCRRHDASVKSRRKVKRLSTALFVISIFCFFFLGFTLFANDQINRGVSSSLNGLDDVTRSFILAKSQGSILNGTCGNSSTHIKELFDVVDKKRKEKGVNQTLVTEIDGALTNISDTVEDVMDRLRKLDGVLIDVSFLDKAHEYGERIEIERWLLLVLVQSVQLCVLFAGVIAFCRQSKKGAVIFSSLGIVIFVVVWLLTAFVLPASVGLSDFCSNGGAFVKAKINEKMIETLDFYKDCKVSTSRDNVPLVLGMKEVSASLNLIQSSKTKLDSLLDQTFNRSAEVANVSSLITADNSKALMDLGALQSSLACYAYKIDVNAMHSGLCSQAMLGAGILLLSLFLLGVMMFILLIVVSRTWHLFTRLPSDYVEVDEDDPFFPRTNDSAIPVDIYGTHVFNPRTRERTDPSTGTTSANTNGTSADEASQPLWRGPSAPPANGTYPRTVLGDYGNYNHDRYEIQ
ncbi:unnamed protein product, partial [Mesorhabditis belari]|uniref:Protein tweety homolog n=1 Tax=Mesorhabditis belari TaxID=2138241 RepID=A0AAF3FID6_9BILA